MNIFDAAILAWETNHPFAYGFTMGVAMMVGVWCAFELYRRGKADERRAELARRNYRAMRRAAIKADGGL